MAFEEHIARCVVGLLMNMLRSINLYDQQRRKARKVSDIRAERMLAPELESKLLTAQLSA